jgi:hypothetical protein
MYMNRVLVLAAIAQAVGTSLLSQAPAAQLSDSAVANRVAGCYELVNDGWQADSNLARFTTLPQAPVRFEVTKTPAKNYARLSVYEHRTYFTILTDSIPDWGRGLFTTWIRLSDTATTIDVSRPLPMAGLELRLAPRNRDLVGTIVSFTDAIPPDGTSETSRPVTARRIPCESLPERHPGSPNHRDAA